MDIANLSAFVAVARGGSFSAAAGRIHLTQPAVSKRVAALEAELGTALFDRIGRTVALTEAGRALLPRAERVLDTLEDSRRAISNLAGRVEGRLTLGTSHHIGLRRLPPVLKAFLARYPHVELDIRFMDSEAVCRAVEQGALEVGVVTLPLDAPETLLAEPIWDDPLVVVAAPGHPLTGRRVAPAELPDWPAVLPERGTFTRTLVEERLATRALRVAMSTNYLETIRMLVTVGLGWGVLPLTMVDGALAVVEVDAPPLHRTLGTVLHHARTLSNAAGALVRTVREAATVQG